MVYQELTDLLQVYFHSLLIAHQLSDHHLQLLVSRLEPEHHHQALWSLVKITFI